MKVREKAPENPVKLNEAQSKMASAWGTRHRNLEVER
jgi:hypothetical protein